MWFGLDDILRPNVHNITANSHCRVQCKGLVLVDCVNVQLGFVDSSFIDRLGYREVDQFADQNAVLYRFEKTVWGLLIDGKRFPCNFVLISTKLICEKLFFTTQFYHNRLNLCLYLILDMITFKFRIFLKTAVNPVSKSNRFIA